jgi:hypothetical protein
LILPAAAFGCWLLAVRIVHSIDYANNDFFTFWLAGHMLPQNGNPYSPEQWVAGHAQFNVTWVPNLAFVYPLPLAVLFAPLGLLPLQQAFILWVALSMGMILASLFLIRPAEITPGNLVLVLSILVGLVFFRPTILTLVSGQLSAWLLFILACIATLWAKEKWAWGSLLLPLLLLKPNLGAPIVLLLSAWLLFTRRYRPLLILGAGAILLAVVGMLKDPAWLLEYLGIGSTKLSHDFGFSPTVWGVANLACRFRSPCTLAAGGVLAVLLAAAVVWILAKQRSVLPPLWAISLAVCATLVITPYTWPYDQLLLLLPISAIIFAVGRRRGGFLPAALFFLGIDLLSLLLLFPNTTMNVEILNAVVPLLVLCILLWMINRRTWIRPTNQ